MKIYVASSWRNKLQPALVAKLRSLGHEVYDYRNPNGEGENTGFAWQSIDPNWRTWTPEQYKLALTHALAQKGFESDERGMIRADACVLLMPSGRSAHVEFGWMVGRGQLGYVLLSEEQFDPDLMYLLTPLKNICTTEEELLARIAEDDERLKSGELRPEYDLHTLKVTGTQTFRSSCAKPNMSPVPRDKEPLADSFDFTGAENLDMAKVRARGERIMTEKYLPPGVSSREFSERAARALANAVPMDRPCGEIPLGEPQVCNLAVPGPSLLVYVGDGPDVVRTMAFSVATKKPAVVVELPYELDGALREAGYVPIEPTLRERLKDVTLKDVAVNAAVYIHAETWEELKKRNSDDAAWFESIRHMLP